VTDHPLPNHESLPVHRHCTDYLVGLDIGELAPGHRLHVRGICLDGDRLWLYYAWLPGLTESMGGDSGVWLNVEYHADVMPETLDCAGAYETSGGPSTEGEIGYDRPPQEARRVWFDFCATSDEAAEHPIRLTIDLLTGKVLIG
jgi:hypothetical protein